MQGWRSILQTVHDNISIIFFFLVIAVFAVGWLVVEAYRSHQNRDEIFKLRLRVAELEREHLAGASYLAGPVVMARHWIRSGSAATTNDGGCLILVDRVSPEQHHAVVTLRVDGYAAAQAKILRVGELFEVTGKSGTYVIEVTATERIQAQISVSLRSRHAGKSSEMPIQ